MHVHWPALHHHKKLCSMHPGMHGDIETFFCVVILVNQYIRTKDNKYLTRTGSQSTCHDNCDIKFGPVSAH
jgi:hypothetical protein